MDDKGRIINLDKPICFDTERLRDINRLGISRRGESANGGGESPNVEARNHKGAAMVTAKIILGLCAVIGCGIGLNKLDAWATHEWAAWKREIAQAEITKLLDGTEFKLDEKTRTVATEMTPMQLKRALFGVEQARQQCEITLGMVRDFVN